MAVERASETKSIPPDSKAVPKYRCLCEDPECDLNKFAKQRGTRVLHFRRWPENISYDI